MSVATSLDKTLNFVESPAPLSRRAYPLRNWQRPLRDWLFERIHGNKLVYNTCWEDPRCDRAMLELDANSEVVMITSAGCNALDYLIDQPKRINCIDVNPRQNALLHLKKAALWGLGWEQFFEIFGQGYSANFEHTYQHELREWLPLASQKYWDKQLNYFKPAGTRQGLYFHGSSGYFAWMANRYLRRHPKLYAGIQRLFSATNLEEQRKRYFAIEEDILKVLVGGPTRQKISLSLVGVPDAQRHLIERQEEGLKGYVRNAFRHIFTELPVQDNYFYHLYLNGSYSRNCCPTYLQQAHFETLKKSIHKLRTYTTTIADFLKQHPNQYSHFVLLDHQDWLAAHAPEALQEEWRLILANSRPGTRILIRSAAPQPDVVPNFVREKVTFLSDLSAAQAKLDRVGTYAGTFLLEVQ